MLILFVTSVLILIIFKTWILKKWNLYRLTSKVPAYPVPRGRYARKGLRDGTHFFKFVKSISEHANKNGGISVIWSQMRPNFFITDPKDAETVLNSCLNKSYTYSFFKRWLGDGILTAEENIWRRHRRLLTPAFTPAVTNTFQPMFNQKAHKLLKLLNEKKNTGPFDIRDYLNEITIEGIYESAIGLSEHDDKEVKQSYTNATQNLLQISMKRMFTPIYHVDFLYMLSDMAREELEMIKIVHDISNSIIKNRKKEYAAESTSESAESKIRFKPFLQLMLELSATHKAFTDQDIRNEVDTIVVAGYDTTSITFLNILIMLGSHPDVQDKVYNEQKNIFQESKQDVEICDLQRMIFLEAVIKETLRMYPLGSVIGRDVKNNIRLRNHVIPAGSSCYISYWGIQHGPAWGPDCNEFKPERWLDPESLPVCAASFGGFSFGKRMCIGKNYAMKFMKTVISQLVRNFEFSADNTKLLQHKLDVSLRPANGFHISVTQR